MTTFHRSRGLCCLLAAGILLAASSGCVSKKGVESEASAGYPTSVGGVTLDSSPRRVVVLSPSLAEITADMGYGAYLAGRSDECDAPSFIASLPSVGSLTDPDADKLASGSPDLVLMQAEPSDTLKALLEEKHIPCAVIPPANTFDDVQKVYDDIGTLFSGGESGPVKGAAQFTALKESLDAVSEKTAAAASQPLGAVYVADSFGHTATGDTVIHRLITCTGAFNPAGASTGWIIPDDALPKVDVIFCPVGMEDAVRKLTRFSNTPAVKNGRVYGLRAGSVERQGQGMADAVEQMARLLYPSAFPEEPSGTESLGSM